MYEKRYIHSAIAILNHYMGDLPFHLYIKKYFSANKKFGSRDRKQITSLCYNYFRLGHSVNNISEEDKILLGTFLCGNESSQFLEALKPEWNGLMEKHLKEKFSILNSQFSIENLFPFKVELSDGIDHHEFNLSYLIQPDLFLRIRPGNNKKVTGKLSGAGISYKLIPEDCIALANASKIDAVIELDEEAVVQDYNSQRSGEFIRLAIAKCQMPISVWDCCAASGGKAIMAYDIDPAIRLTVSDKRVSILENLKKRFAKAGIKKYESFVADIGGDGVHTVREGAVVDGVQTAFSVQTDFDLIICDAPCTGSGTWARTPEHLRYFKKGSIEKYADLQKTIAKNVIPYLKRGGHFLYITCSVFKKENEEVVRHIEENCNLQLKKMELLKGYEIKADTLFAALFIAR